MSFNLNDLYGKPFKQDEREIKISKLNQEYNDICYTLKNGGINRDPKEIKKLNEYKNYLQQQIDKLAST